jgi:hypothetical protein
VITKIDLYTKAMLTVIAICLAIMTVRSLGEPGRVWAQSDAPGLRVVLAGYDMRTLGRGIPVNILGAGENAAVPVTLAGGGPDGDGAVPVNVVNAAVPVSVNGNGQEGKAPVQVNVVQVSSRNPPVFPVDLVQVAGEPVPKGTTLGTRPTPRK